MSLSNSRWPNEIITITTTTTIIIITLLHLQQQRLPTRRSSQTPQTLPRTSHWPRIHPVVVPIICICYAAAVFVRVVAFVFAFSGPVDFSLFVESTGHKCRNFAVSFDDADDFRLQFSWCSFCFCLCLCFILFLLSSYFDVAFYSYQVIISYSFSSSTLPIEFGLTVVGRCVCHTEVFVCDNNLIMVWCRL